MVAGGLAASAAPDSTATVCWWCLPERRERSALLSVHVAAKLQHFCLMLSLPGCVGCRAFRLMRGLALLLLVMPVLPMLLQTLRRY